MSTNEDEISENLNLNQSVTFGFPFSSNKEPVMIPFYANEKVSDLIERFRKRCNLYDEKAKFIYDGKNLNVDLTVEEAGIKNNYYIFVDSNEVGIYKINFKFLNLKNSLYPIKIIIGEKKSVLELIKRFLKEVYLNGEGFKFILNSQQLEKENLSIEKLGFTEKQEIFVETERPLKIISLIFKFFDNDNNINTDVIVNLYISALIKIIENNFNLKVKQLIFNYKELDRELTVEEAGLKNNDIIYIIKAD